MRHLSLLLLFTSLLCITDTMPVAYAKELGPQRTFVNPAITSDGQPVLKLLSYNLYFMSRYIMPFWGQELRAKRMLEEEKLFDSYDVIVLQEAWDAKTREILLAGLYEQGYQHQTAVTGRKKADTDGAFCKFCPYNGGVVIASRHPILETSQFVYKDACGMDFFSTVELQRYFRNKGFVYVKLQVENYAKPVHILGTHLQADDTFCSETKTPRSVRENQLGEMANFIENKIRDGNIGPDELVIYAGDFNINLPSERRPNPPETPDAILIGATEYESDAAAYSKPEYDHMSEILNAKPAKQLIGFHSTFDPVSNDIAGSNYPGYKPEYIDHVLLRQMPSADGTPLMEFDTVQIAIEVHTDEYKLGLPFFKGGKFHELSDHYPIEYTIMAKNPSN